MDVDTGFFEGLAAGELRIQRCVGCRTWTWPAQWRCGACGSWDLGWEAVPKRGEIYSYARTHHLFRPGSHETVPYTSLLVALEQAGGARLLGRLVGPEEGLRIGAPVEGLIELGDDGAVMRWRLIVEQGR